MKYAYKTEIKPTAEQAQKIKRSLGICRWLYNRYIEANKRLYRMYQRGLLDKNQSYFMTANDFDKYVNHKLKTKKEYIWLNKCGSKARKKALMNAEAAFRNFFAGNTAFPKFKKKTDEDVKLYFPKNNAGDWLIERHSSYAEICKAQGIRLSADKCQSHKRQYIVQSRQILCINYS